MTDSTPLIVIPGDDPPQIADSPRLKVLEQHGRVEIFDTRPANEAEQLKRVSGARVVLNSRGQVKWPGHVLEQLPDLKMLAVCGIGTDAIDLEAAGKLGITVCNLPGRTATLVAEHAFALLLSISRRTAFFTAAVRAGRWPRRLGTSLLGKTLGVIGTGNIGCEMSRLSSAFGMEVIAWSFHPDEDKAERYGFRYVELEELLSRSDALSLHLKLTDDSRGFLGDKELANVRPGCLLVNTARGVMIDNAAVIGALEDGRLGGVALDVFDQEPIQREHPLLQCDQVVFTPHSADQTPEGVDLLNLGCVENVIAFLEGRPQNVVV